VLDVGSGIGDVSLLLCSLVGPTGEVVGVERDASSIARARARTEAAGFDNVSFLESDVTDVRAAGSFDAVVGRFILMYLPDPARTLRSLARLLRPHGAVAFLEPSWAAVRGLAAHLPLYTAFTAAIIDSFRACGDAEFTQALCDILQSLEPRARQKGVSFEALGDLRTFGARLHAEIQSSGDPISWLGGNVGAWCRLPGDVATALAS
jgi:ubiquinone/menaquinone biosynthesis C-methylase UbiE